MPNRPSARRAAGARAATTSQRLSGTIAVVAGATRGAGRGIARGLGEAGATVYCTGRSVAGAASPYGGPETIDETAQLVTAAGGTGIAVRCDHTVEDEVRAVFQRIDREHGRLDVLVNAVAGETPLLGGWSSFWEADLANGAAALQHALLSHVVAAKHAAPRMIATRRGLIVEVIEGDLLFASGSVLAQLVKFALKGFTQTMAEELRSRRVTAIAITPGFLRSETMLRYFGVTEENWRDGGKKDPNFLESESPLFIGRAVAALAADRKLHTRTGQITSSWEAARVYGFSDADGSRPDWGKHGTQTVIPSMTWMRTGIERHAEWLEGLSRRAREYLAGT